MGTKLPDGTLDLILQTKARDMYKHEYLAMAEELKELRNRFNRKEADAEGMTCIPNVQLMSLYAGVPLVVKRGEYEMQYMGTPEWVITKRYV